MRLQRRINAPIVRAMELTGDGLRKEGISQNIKLRSRRTNMSIKSLAAVAAIAMAATIGSAYAAERFNTLDGIAADLLTPQEMDGVIGSAVDSVTMTITNGHGQGGGIPTDKVIDFDGGSAQQLFDDLDADQKASLGATGGVITNGVRTFTIVCTGGCAL